MPTNCGCPGGGTETWPNIHWPFSSTSNDCDCVRLKAAALAKPVAIGVVAARPGFAVLIVIVVGVFQGIGLPGPHAHHQLLLKPAISTIEKETWLIWPDSFLIVQFFLLSIELFQSLIFQKK